MITPAQLRNAARFGQSLRKETLLELADRLERLERCDAPRRHSFNEPVLVSTTEDVETHLVACKHCEFTMYNHRNLEVG